MISICIATRKRPETFKQMCLSAMETASDPNNIEFVTYHDKDDNSVYEYVGNHKEVTGERISIILAANECQKIATGPIYMFGADDMIFETKDWDKKIEEAFFQYPDRIVLVCPDNNDWGRWKFGVTGFLHKNWIDAVGHFLPPYKDGQSADQWVNEVAMKINRRTHLLDVKVEHLCIRDQVHKEKNKKGREQQYTKRYYLPEMAEIRIRESELLNKFINDFTPITKISLLLPTRGRPEAFKSMCLSALENASDPNDIEFVSYHDKDDNSVYEYVGNHTEVIGERIIHSQMFNECYKVAKGDICMLAVDDIHFLTNGWDTMVKETFNASKDKIIFVYPNDGYYRSGFGVVGFLHKNWIDTVGYFLPPYFDAQYADNWINELSRVIDRRVFLRGMRIKNIRITDDSTHQEYIIKCRESKAIYHSKEKADERAKDAKLLQGFIDNFKQ